MLQAVASAGGGGHGGLRFGQCAGAASAQIRSADGTIVGSALIPSTSSVIVVRIGASGLPSGHYGVRLHALGRCDGPGFELDRSTLHRRLPHRSERQ